MISILCVFLASAAEPVAPPADPIPTDEVVTSLLAREAELLQAVENNDPRHHDRLVALRDVDRRSYLAALYKVSKLVERTRSDPAFAERRRQIAERDEQLRLLAVGFAALQPVEQQARRAQMLALAGELMELKQAERRLKLEELRSRLEALEREIEQRERDREVIVGEYVDRMLR